MFWLDIIVPGVPEPKGSFTRTKNGGFMWGSGGKSHERLKEWAHRVKTYAQRSARVNGITEPSDDPIAMDLTFYMPRPKSAPKSRYHALTRPDLDKLCRLVGDALIGVIYTEDSRIVQLSSRKVYADAENPPGVSISVRTV